MARELNMPLDADTAGVSELSADPRGSWKPLSWSAIVAGTVAALGTQLILTLIGAGIGAVAISPGSDNTRGFGAGALIWLILSGIISFGVGGYIAGYISGFTRTSGGAIHGMLAWALAAALGASVTMIAGAATAGPAALGAGIAARGTSFSAGNFAARGNQPSEAALTAPNGGTTLSEAEARAKAERAAEVAGRVSLGTGIAFLVSALTAMFSGMAGRAKPIRMPDLKRDPHQRMAHA